MKHIGIIKPDTYIDILNCFGFPIAILYFFSMLIYPAIHSGGDWSYLQSVWHNWQPLNVGVLAFISSLIAFNIVRYNENKQRSRKFIAAKAFLPEALSELTHYFQDCASIYIGAWEKLVVEDPEKSRFAPGLPKLNDSYKEIFSKCISVAEPDVADYLATVLVHLQIHRSRIREIINILHGKSNLTIDESNIYAYMFRLAQLHASVGRLFGYARGLNDFDNSRLTLDDFHNSYANLDIFTDLYGDLWEFTQRNINSGLLDRNNRGQTTVS